MIAIRVTMQPDGSLLMQANNATRAELSESLRHSYERAECDFLEMVRGNYAHTFPDGRAVDYTLEWLDPADIFALTDMPMLADAVRDDDDAMRVYGPVWGFPDYAIRDYLRELATTGRTQFPMVEDFGRDGMTFPSRFNDKATAERLAMRAYENCIDGVMVTEEIPDAHGEPGDTIRRLVDIAPPAPPPAAGDLFA